MDPTTALAQKISDAAFAEDLNELKKLLDAGADVNARDTDGFSALHRACVTGKTNVIKFLLENGADVSTEDLYGDSPLHYACFCGHEGAVSLLLEKGANPLQPSQDGKTPIDSAREEKHESLFPILEKYAPEAVRLKPMPPPVPKRFGRSDKSKSDADIVETSTTVLGGTGETGHIAGLDFSTGVIIEGELHKKRANKVLAWRRKYYVLSNTYGAMFFWTGSRQHQEGVIKKVRFETFYGVEQHMDKKDGRRFDIRVVTGRTMCLLANTAKEADLWVQTIKSSLGRVMLALKIQAMWRGYRARKRLASIKKERAEAVQRIISNNSLPDNLRPDANGVVIEGPLKKKNASSLSNILGAWRARYFVLNIKDAQLYYYETKAKRNAGILPRTLPIVTFFSVSLIKDPKLSANGRRFNLKDMSGRLYTFESPNSETTLRWVTALQAILPRDHIAAVKMQSFARMVIARTRFQRKAAMRTGLLNDFAAERGLTPQATLAAITKAQANIRMLRQHNAYLKAKRAREEQEERAKAIRSRRLWLTRSRRGGGATTEETDKTSAAAPELGAGTKGRLARLRALKAKKAKEEPVQSSEIPVIDWASLAIVDKDGVLWTEHVDENTQQKFYANPSGDALWEKPENTVGTENYPYIAHTDASTEDVFYANNSTGETFWEAPPGWEDHCKASDAVAVKMAYTNPDAYPWTATVDESSGETFYLHAGTQQTQWEKPAGFDAFQKARANALASQSGPSEGATSDTKTIDTPSAESWSKMEDPATGKSYWYNTATGERRFEDPNSTEAVRDAVVKDTVDDEESDAESSEEPTDLTDWEEVLDPASNRIYYFNKQTGKSQWHKPGTAAIEELVDPHEALSFSCFINDMLSEEANLPNLPLDLELEPPALLSALRNGIILTKLLNRVAPESVDERVLDFSAVAGQEVHRDDAPESVVRPARENLQVVLSAATSLGVVLPTKDISEAAASLENGDAQITMNVVWQIWKLHLVKLLRVRDNMNLLTLAQEGESAQDLISLTPEDILIRWVNFQMAKTSEVVKPAETLTDLNNGVALSVVLRCIAPEYCSELPPTAEQTLEVVKSGEEQATEFANNVLAAAFGIGVPAWFSSGALIEHNQRLIFALTALLFEVAPNLPVSDTENESADVDTDQVNSMRGSTKQSSTIPSTPSLMGPRAARGTLSSADVANLRANLAKMSAEVEAGGSRESRTFTTWINSLGIDRLYINDLVSDCRDGVVLLRVIDHIEPGIVKWKRVTKQPKSRYTRVENCNYVITLGKAMDFHLVNVGGLDIVDGNAKLIHAVVWQLMRHHTLKVLSQIAFDGFGADEADILAWANEQVLAVNNNDESTAIRSFKDPKLSTGVFLLRLLSCVRPIVDWDIVSEGNTQKEKEQNAKYAISAARKLGAIVFCAWDDIVQVSQRMIMLFVASVMVASKEQTRVEKTD